MATTTSGVTVEIGGMPILFTAESADFCRVIERRYGGFVNPGGKAQSHFQIHLNAPAKGVDEDARVQRQGHEWTMERGDFQARWDTRTRRGWIRQAPNPYSLDAVLRMVHSLVLAEEGGFLIHAASAVRDGRGFIFAGVSGVGKTTMARMAPPDAVVLTDEVSYVRCAKEGYLACGTPFAGELGHSGKNLTAPLDTIFLLEQGPVNRVEEVGPVEAVRALLRHILFFAQDAKMVKRMFDSAWALIARVPVKKLVFLPEPGCWELVQ